MPRLNLSETRLIFTEYYGGQGIDPSDVACLVTIRLAEMSELSKSNILGTGTEDYYRDPYFDEQIPPGSFNSGSERAIALINKVRQSEISYFKRLGFVDEEDIGFLIRVNFLLLIGPGTKATFDKYLYGKDPNDEQARDARTSRALELIAKIKQLDKIFYQGCGCLANDADYLSSISLGLTRIHLEPKKDIFEKCLLVDKQEKETKETEGLRAMTLVAKVAPFIKTFLPEQKSRRELESTPTAVLRYSKALLRTSMEATAAAFGTATAAPDTGDEKRRDEITRSITDSISHNPRNRYPFSAPNKPPSSGSLALKKSDTFIERLQCVLEVYGYESRSHEIPSMFPNEKEHQLVKKLLPILQLGQNTQKIIGAKVTLMRACKKLIETTIGELITLQNQLMNQQALINQELASSGVNAPPVLFTSGLEAARVHGKSKIALGANLPEAVLTATAATTAVMTTAVPPSAKIVEPRVSL